MYLEDVHWLCTIGYLVCHLLQHGRVGLDHALDGRPGNCGDVIIGLYVLPALLAVYGTPRSSTVNRYKNFGEPVPGASNTLLITFATRSMPPRQETPSALYPPTPQCAYCFCRTPCGRGVVGSAWLTSVAGCGVRGEHRLAVEDNNATADGVHSTFSKKKTRARAEKIALPI